MTKGVVYEAGDVKVIAAPTDHRPVHPSIGYRVEHDGHVAVIAGDTVPCDGLDRLCQGADIYVQTVIKREIMESFPVVRLQQAAEYHSDSRQAGDTAARAGVRTLVLNHPVPAPPPGTEQE